jgi:hypothetical protein
MLLLSFEELRSEWVKCHKTVQQLVRENETWGVYGGGRVELCFMVTSFAR